MKKKEGFLEREGERKGERKHIGEKWREKRILKLSEDETNISPNKKIDLARVCNWLPVELTKWHTHYF